eukprot:3612193-Prymnesium_polylepis.1
MPRGVVDVKSDAVRSRLRVISSTIVFVHQACAPRREKRRPRPARPQAAQRLAAARAAGRVAAGAAGVRVYARRVPLGEGVVRALG